MAETGAPMDKQHCTHEEIIALCKVIAALFEKWQLSPEEQLQLMGKPISACIPLSPESDVDSNDMHRIECLLAIHKSLRLLYPYDPDMRFRWIKSNNKLFDNQAPLKIMHTDGIAGMEVIVEHLAQLLG